MYGIQRNIKNKKVKEDEPMVLESDGYENHKFILDGYIPAGHYYCKLVRAFIRKTEATKKPALEVLYKIRSLSACYKIINDKTATKEEKVIYYIKEVYPLHTDYYKNFLVAMRKALGLRKNEKMTTEDVVGVEERIFIGFDGNSKFGSIKSREPFVYEDYIEYHEELMQDDEDVENDNAHQDNIVQSNEREQTEEDDDYGIDWDSWDDD